MFARTRFTALIGALFLVPLMFACEGYDQPGEDEELLETEQQEEVRPGQEEQARPGQQQQQEEMETRQQRREAETERGERPERPAPPEETDEAAGEEEEMTERMSMTEFSVEIPEDLSSGSYTLSCPVPEDARRQQAGQEQTQPTRDDVQLQITVRQGQGQQETSTNNR